MNPTKDSTNPGSLISTRNIDRYRTSSDASHFAFIPSAVATARNAEDIAQLFRYATENHTSVTFRSGGTSLSGQGVSDAILIDTRKYFRSIEILNDGAQVKVQPGATVRAINARLARFGRKLGPDPASEIACTIGGVIANNSSGMACGITDNTYRTLASATIVLFNGTTIDTASPDSDSLLEIAAPGICAAITEIKEEIRSKPELIERIRKQYLIKNTMGYGLNSFIDFDSITDILLHLLIGSEGTLGFISEAIFNTVPLLSKSATGLLIFENLQKATGSLAAISATGPTTIELMDAASLRAGKVDLDGLELRDHTALLVEYQAYSDDQLAMLTQSAQDVLRGLGTIATPTLTTDQSVRASLWHIRKGLYAAVAGAREPGTTALLEDIAVPVDQIEPTCTGLQELFLKHGYLDAVIFGHAKDGNIHFLINEDFSDAIKAERYRLFTEDMVQLVLSKSGSLKAEHGTGRMMAPFVERQFGSDLYALMVKIKSAFDPAHVINPGVLISSDSLSHMHNIKFNPRIQEVADKCVECGYCEPICPSKDLTTTPRQRIVIRRAMVDAQMRGDTALYDSLRKESEYDVEESCAADGLCENSCPVGINTGSLVRELRSDRIGSTYSRIWNSGAKNWGSNVRRIGRLLTVASHTPAFLIHPLNHLLRKTLGDELIPLWSADLPKGGKVRAPIKSENPDFVLFTSCLETMFESRTADSLTSLASKAALSYRIPAGIADLCCGTPWKSKGISAGYATMAEKTYEALLVASENGKIPIVCENSSCSEGLIKAVASIAGEALTIIDSVDFAAEFILPKLNIKRKLGAVVLHPTCSSTLLGSQKNLERIAEAISESVTVPVDWGCCAFAGDRGMLHPELTASASALEATTVNQKNYDAYLSTNFTCEVGMSRATGQHYQHILTQLNDAT